MLVFREARTRLITLALAVLGGMASTALLAQEGGTLGSDATIRVPDEYATIQSAIDAVSDGATIVVAPGIYHESLVISGKRVKLVSQFVATGDQRLVHKTVLSGEVLEIDENEGRAEQVLLIESNVDPDTEIAGFTIRGGDDGISCHARITIRNNRFIDNVDAIDYEGGGGLCEHNYFERNEDDAIDLDRDCDVTIRHNHLLHNLDDGIEIRLHPHAGEMLRIVVQENVIAGNAEDGIQIIDYPGKSNRRIRIERNLIARNLMAGIGVMSNANTREEYEAAPIPERMEIVGNTIADSTYGLSAGGNLEVSRNTFLQNHAAAIRYPMEGDSPNAANLRSQNLYWRNGAELESN